MNNANKNINGRAAPPAGRTGRQGSRGANCGTNRSDITVKPQLASRAVRRCPTSARGGLPHNRKGSIMIWSVMLGFVLTSVFFFFGIRQRANVAIQRDTATILNTRGFMRSYASYLKNLSPPSEIPSGTKYNDELEVTLTQNVSAIEGFVDRGVPETYTFVDTVFVEWNKCENKVAPGSLSDLLINGSLYPSGDGNCDSGKDYDDVETGINVDPSIEIETLNTPTFFKINGSNLTDNRWHLTLEANLDYGKTIKIEEIF